MAQNKIQFQRGLSLAEFFSRYGSEEQCEQALERMRWPKGFVCPRCEGTAAGPSSFRVEPNRQNGRSSSSPVGMWAGCL
jgi:hypothetical protein